MLIKLDKSDKRIFGQACGGYICLFGTLRPGENTEPAGAASKNHGCGTRDP